MTSSSRTINTIYVEPEFKATGDGLRRPSWSRQNQLCILSGSVTKATTAAEDEIAQLPASCRPEAEILFHVPTLDGAFITLGVSSNRS